MRDKREISERERRVEFGANVETIQRDPFAKRTLLEESVREEIPMETFRRGTRVGVSGDVTVLERLAKKGNQTTSRGVEKHDEESSFEDQVFSR